MDEYQFHIVVRETLLPVDGQWHPLVDCARVVKVGEHLRGGAVVVFYEQDYSDGEVVVYAEKKARVFNTDQLIEEARYLAYAGTISGHGLHVYVG